MGYLNGKETPESIDQEKISNYNNLDGATRNFKVEVESEEFKQVTNMNSLELKKDKVFGANLERFNKNYHTSFDISMIAHLKTLFGNKVSTGIDPNNKAVEDNLKSKKTIYEQLEKELFSKEKEKKALLISVTTKKLSESIELSGGATLRRSDLDLAQIKEIEKKLEKFNKENKTDVTLVDFSYLQAFFSRADFAQAIDGGPNRLKLPTETIDSLKTIYPIFKDIAKGLAGYNKIEDTEKLLAKKQKEIEKNLKKEANENEKEKNSHKKEDDNGKNLEVYEEEITSKPIKIDENHAKQKTNEVGQFMKKSGRTGIELNNKFVGKKIGNGIEVKRKKVGSSEKKEENSDTFYSSGVESNESNNTTFEGQEILENIYETIGLPMTVNGFIKNIEQKTGPYKDILNLNVEKRNIEGDGSFNQRIKIDKINNISGNINIDKNGLLKMTNPFSRDSKNFSFSETSTVKMHALSEFEELIDENFLLQLAEKTLEEGKNVEAGEEFQKFFQTKFQEKLETAITEKINDMTDPKKLSEKQTQEELERHLNKFSTGSRLLTFFKPTEKMKKYCNLGETIDEEKNPGSYRYLTILKNTIEKNNINEKGNLNYSLLNSFERLQNFRETNKKRINSYQGGLPHRYKEMLEFFNGKENEQPNEEKFLKFIEAFVEGKDEKTQVIEVEKLDKFVTSVEKNEPLKENNTTVGLKTLLEETKLEKEKKTNQAITEAHEKTDAELDLALKTVV
ncbi:MAG TPA: hypothetical protein PKC14_01270 [Candidatus Absconditabacterales bacterium]|nr:hypothetical protein [Candidatus Absconditabacterales bacterium]